MSRKKKKEKRELKTTQILEFLSATSEEADITAGESEAIVVLDEIINVKESAPDQISEISEETETFKEVENKPIEECKHEFKMQNGGTYKKNSKGIPHFYKTFICEKCGYSETRIF